MNNNPRMEASVASSLVPADDGFAYDVVISYRHQEPDRSWVRTVRLPRLKASGLRVCIDYESFRLGAPLVLEMARAVEQSRFTLAMLSEAYLQSTFTELENVLAEQLGLEQSQRRLLAALRGACKPRLGMRARLMLDMPNSEDFEVELVRLLSALHQARDD